MLSENYGKKAYANRVWGKFRFKRGQNKEKSKLLNLLQSLILVYFRKKNKVIQGEHHKSVLTGRFWGWTSTWVRMEWRKERNRSHSITEKQVLGYMPQAFARNFTYIYFGLCDPFLVNIWNTKHKYEKNKTPSSWQSLLISSTECF